ncbi:MAG TPA: 2'-5' RNA ligase family protein [Ferruginibacter sp.]|jgi:2'-5' RNA ligase|nr:2'-5' RNA ligase family protein [Ferruginibacter sp.]
MATNPIQLPAYRHSEYLLVVSPHEELRNKILQVKETFREKYKTSMHATKPHITLVKFNGLQVMEERLKQRLQVIGMGTSPFKIDLKDYGSFPTHTIYIHINTKNAIQELVKELRTARRLMKSPDHDPHFIMEPHISIAMKLLPWQYEQGWLEYSHRHFSGSFIADGMLLLRKREGETQYQIVQRFEFMNLPVATKQGELFA